MTIKKILLITFYIFTLNLLFCSTVFSCSISNHWWDTHSPCKRFNNSNFVALGVVSKVSIVESDNQQKGRYNQILSFTIQESFKGKSKKVVYLKDSYGSSCDEDYKIGDEFIVFSNSYPNSSNTYDINLFSTTLKGSDDFDRYLDYCRLVKKGLAGATISGVFARSIRESVDDSIEYNKLAGVNILIQGSKSKYQLKTDEDGKFILHGIKAGTYKIISDIYQWSGEAMSIEVNLGANDCEEISALTTEQSSIKGILANPKGEIASEVEMQLIALDPITNKPIEENLSAITGKDGEFIFANVPEGRYLLAHNYAEESYFAKTKYATSFFPGVTDFNIASIIEIKNRQTLNLGVYKLIAESR